MKTDKSRSQSQTALFFLGKLRGSNKGGKKLAFCFFLGAQCQPVCVEGLGMVTMMMMVVVMVRRILMMMMMGILIARGDNQHVMFQ